MRKDLIEGLYSIKASPKSNGHSDFDANLPFAEEPSSEEIIDLLKLLRPHTEYQIETIKVKRVGYYYLLQ